LQLKRDEDTEVVDEDDEAKDDSGNAAPLDEEPDQCPPQRQSTRQRLPTKGFDKEIVVGQHYVALVSMESDESGTDMDESDDRPEIVLDACLPSGPGESNEPIDTIQVFEETGRHDSVCCHFTTLKTTQAAAVITDKTDTATATATTLGITATETTAETTSSCDLHTDAENN
jgi:hypothetical protein